MLIIASERQLTAHSNKCHLLTALLCFKYLHYPQYTQHDAYMLHEGNLFAVPTTKALKCTEHAEKQTRGQEVGLSATEQLKLSVQIQ